MSCRTEIRKLGKADVPYVTAEQMREVDRAMVEDYGIALVQMMENAGRALARVATSRFLRGDARGMRVLVLAGRGGNGGGGMVCARRLHAWGGDVTVLTTAPDERYRGEPAKQLDILGRMDVPVSHAVGGAPLPGADLVIDAMIGYSLSGAPAGVAASLVRATNLHVAPVLSL